MYTILLDLLNDSEILIANAILIVVDVIHLNEEIVVQKNGIAFLKMTQ